MTIKEFKEDKRCLAIHCKTKEQINKVIKAMPKLSAKLSENWYGYKEQDGILIYNNWGNNGCTSWDVLISNSADKIIPFEEIEDFKEKEMKKFKIGDRVKCLRPTDDNKNIVGEYGTIIDNNDMDKWNRVGVEFDNNINGHNGSHDEGKSGHCWNCVIDTLEKIPETKLENITLQKGDRVVFGDGEIYYEIKGNGYFAENHKRVIKVERPTGYTTIYESPKKDILDKEEKEYLSAVIKPFRNKVTSIVKIDIDYTGEYIKIKLGKCNDIVSLPYFDTGTMYKGMEQNIEYTLEELGL